MRLLYSSVVSIENHSVDLFDPLNGFFSSDLHCGADAHFSILLSDTVTLGTRSYSCRSLRLGRLGILCILRKR